MQTDIKTTKEFTESIDAWCRKGVGFFYWWKMKSEWAQSTEGDDLLSIIRHCPILFRYCKPWRKHQGGMGQVNDPVSQSQSPGNWTSAAAML